MSIRYIGFARSWLEVLFLLEIERCPSCGERELGQTSSRSGIIKSDEHEGVGGFCYVTCPSCGFQRAVRYFEEPDFGVSRKEAEIGGPSPSTIIQPNQFAKELAWSLGDLEKNPPRYLTMTKEQRLAHGERWSIADDCVKELLKFIPAGADEVPASAFTTDEGKAYREAHRTDFTRTGLDDTAKMLVAVRGAIKDAYEAETAARIAAGIEAPPQPLPLPPFSLAALKFHERWVANGDGPEAQRMTGKGVDLRGRNLIGRDLSRSEFENINFDQADLTRSRWNGARLVSASAWKSQWTSAQLAGATLERCIFSSASMVDARLFDSVLTACRFVEMDLTRTLWFRSLIIGGHFTLKTKLVDAALDGATFTDCDFKACDLSVTQQGPLGMAVGTRFFRCDLRDTNWEGRDLFRVSFVACKLAGARGLPLLSETVIEDIDLSPGGDGCRIASRAEVLRQWGIENERAEIGSLVYDLTPDEASCVVEIARAHDWEARVWVVTHADGYRHWVRVRSGEALPAVGNAIEREMVARGHRPPVLVPRTLA